MSGCVTLTEEEKREMLLDARDPMRREAFAAAQRSGHTGTLDEYFDFFSENRFPIHRNKGISPPHSTKNQT